MKKLIGYKKVQMHQEGQEPFTFYSLYYTQDIGDYKNKDSDVTCEGVGCGYVSVGSNKIPEGFTIGCEFEVFYNKNGKVGQIFLQ